jgi:XRE family transcriptional regulator, aerobic/anaerobic benzoate catabolism transcriptional regulator
LSPASFAHYISILVIFHSRFTAKTANEYMKTVKSKEVKVKPPTSNEPAPQRAEFLLALGEQVRMLRAQRGMTRKAVAVAADVSERHLANLEQGVGNASILVLLQIAQALQCSLAELLGDVTTRTPEWLMIRELLSTKPEEELRRARQTLAQLFNAGTASADRHHRIALVGLRGAGKSTLGQGLAKAWGCKFVELSRDIEQLAGCSVGEIHNLYGVSAYRRYEHRALEQVIEQHPRAVVAMPGALVADSSSFSLMLGTCFTVWLQASPQDHMARVIAQGDMRPVAASKEAMEDLKRILEGRKAFYSKADLSFNTSDYTVSECLPALMAHIKQALPSTSG